MALGRLVLTTSIGLEGIDARHGKEVLIADDVEDYVKAIQFCHGNRTDMLQIAQNGYDFVHKYYSNRNLARLLKDFPARIRIIQDLGPIHLIPLFFDAIKPCFVRLLIVTSRFPFPLEKGDKLRMYHQLRYLQERHEVVLVSLTARRPTEDDFPRN